MSSISSSRFDEQGFDTMVSLVNSKFANLINNSKHGQRINRNAEKAGRVLRNYLLSKFTIFSKKRFENSTRSSAHGSK